MVSVFFSPGVCDVAITVWCVFSSASIFCNLALPNPLWYSVHLINDQFCRKSEVYCWTSTAMSPKNRCFWNVKLSWGENELRERLCKTNNNSSRSTTTAHQWTFTICKRVQHNARLNNITQRTIECGKESASSRSFTRSFTQACSACMLPLSVYAFFL